MNRQQAPRVIVFTTAYVPFLGGAEVAISELVKRMPKMRFLIITARRSRSVPSKEYRDNIEIRRLGFGFSIDTWLLPIFGFFVGLYSLRDSALLWGVMISQGTLAAYGIKLFFPETPFAVTLQEGDSEEYLRKARFGLIHFFWKRVLRKADGVTAISTYLAKRARSLGYKKELAIIPNGVDERFVSPSFEPDALKELREKLGITSQERIIFSSSRLVKKNGIDDLIRAVARLYKEKYPIKLLLIGDGKERQSLKVLAEKLNIKNSVIFLGSVPNEEILPYYGISDIFARPSRSEGLGVSFLEALGVGVPIIATPVGGIVDFIENRTTGIFVRPGDVSDIARGLKELLDNPDLCRDLAKNGTHLIMQKYLADKFPWQ